MLEFQTIKWPIQANPDQVSWRIWRSAIRKTFEIYGKVAPGMIRAKWKQDLPRDYKWYHDHISDCLLRQTANNKWKMFRASIQRGRRATFPIYHCIQTELSSLPNHAKPASIIVCSAHRVKFTGSGLPATMTPNNQISSLEDYVNALPEKEKWPFQNISGRDNLNHIVNAIQSGNCALVSDGSFAQNNQQAAAAWVIGNEAFHRQLSGKVVCTGSKDHHSAYRGELAGIYGGLRMLEAICSTNKIQNGRIILGCDGRGALEKIQHRTSTLSAKHFDYITSIKSILSSLPIKVTFVHVTGHADKKIPLHQLSPLERMNVQVDTLAKEHNERLRQDDELEALDLNREAGPVRISCGQQLTKIKSKFRNKLYETITAIPTETYWLEKLKIDSNQRKNIEWTQMGLAFEEIPIERQKELVKWNSDFCGTSKWT